MNVDTDALWWLFALVFIVAGTLFYFLGWSDAKKPTKTTTITIAVNSSIRAKDIIQDGEKTYEVVQVGHFFKDNPCTTLTVKEINPNDKSS